MCQPDCTASSIVAKKCCTTPSAARGPTGELGHRYGKAVREKRGKLEGRGGDEKGESEVIAVRGMERH